MYTIICESYERAISVPGISMSGCGS